MADYVYKGVNSASDVAAKLGVTARLTDSPSLEFTVNEFHEREVKVSLPGVTLSDSEKTTLQNIASTMNWGYLAD